MTWPGYHNADWNKDLVKKELEFSKRFTKTLNGLYDKAEECSSPEEQKRLFETVASDAILRITELEIVLERLLSKDMIK